MNAWCYVKVHRQGGDMLVAVCDEELLGRELDTGSFKLPIRPEFYAGERVPLDRLWEYLEGATMINAFGDRVVSELAKRIPIINLAAVRIGGVLHVQLILR
ncbi:MAG: DUF424 family protein [Thermofilaceae archaeon]